MSYPYYLDDMESQLASYLGEDFSTFSSNENPTVSVPLDSLEESSNDTNGQFSWDDFLKEEGIQTNSPPLSTWEWNPTEAEFYRNEIVAPPTVDEPSSREPTQSSRREGEAPINVESENTNEQHIATPSEPESQPEENLDIADNDSPFDGDTFNANELTVPNNANHPSGKVTTPDEQPPKTSEQEQEENIDIPDSDSLFGGNTSDDVEVQKSDEEHGSETTMQEANGTPEFVADTPQHSDSAASAPITPGADINNNGADNDIDSLFGDIDDSGLGDGSQPPENKSPTGDNTPTEAPADAFDDLFGSEIEADFEAELATELEAELRKDSTNGVAPVVPMHTGLHLLKPPRKVAKFHGLHLPDPPRAIGNPQRLHLPAPPQNLARPQGLYLPDPTCVVASPQELNRPDAAPVPAPVVANSQGLHLPSPPPVTFAQQRGVDTPAQEETGSQEDEASTMRRRVRASKIPRSDMSRPKGRGQAGKVLTQLSGPAPSKLPDTAPSSSSGADGVDEKVTRLPRWAFGKYTSFGKPVAGSRYKKPNDSANNPIPVEDEPQAVEETNGVNPGNQNVAQPAPEIPDAIDLTSDTQERLAVEISVQDNQILNHSNAQESTRPYEDFQIPASGNEMEFTYGDDPLPNFPNELSFQPVIDDTDPAPELQPYQLHSSVALEDVPPVAAQYGVLPPSIMEDFSLYGQASLANSYNSYRLQVPNVHSTGTSVHQSSNVMKQTGVQNYQPISQPMQTGNYEQGNGYVLGDDTILDNSAATGGSNSSGLDNSRPKKRLSHERAEYSDPRVLMTYDEFKQVFPQEQTRGCFETAIQNERAADAAIVARGGVPSQRPTIRKSIICTWSQVQHLNRIRAANGEKLFEPKPNAHKRPQAFKESLRRKRQDRGEISESEESDMEPEAKRLRLAQEPTKMAQSSGEKYGERSSQIRFVQPDNLQVSANVPHLPPNNGALQGHVSQGKPAISFPQIHQPVRNVTPHVGQHSERTPEMHPTQPSDPQVSAAVSHPPFNHGIPRGPHAQNMDQGSSTQINHPMPQSFKRKMNTEQWKGLETAEQEMRPTAKRPKLALSSRQHPEPTRNHSRMDWFQRYVSERQSEYLKLRVPELRKLCKTRKVKHGKVNDLTKGGLVGVLVGQDVSRHPVYSQMHHKAHAGQRHPASNIGEMGRMNPPSVAANRSQQQLRESNCWGIRQNLPAPNVGPAQGMGLNHHQLTPSQFPNTSDHRAPGPAPMRFGNSAPPVTNSGPNRGPSHGHSQPVNAAHVEQLRMNGNPSGPANNGGQPLTSIRHPQNIRQAPRGSMTTPSPANLYAQSRLPVSAYSNGYNNSGIQQNLDGSRNNHTSASANAHIPAYGIAGDFGTGIYQPAVDDRRRKPRIQGQDVPGRVPKSSQRSIPQPAMDVPQPAMNNTRQYTSTQQPIVGSASGNIRMGHPVNNIGSQIPRPAHSGNMGDDRRRFMQNHAQVGLYSAPMQGPFQGTQQHDSARSPQQPYYGPP